MSRSPTASWPEHGYIHHGIFLPHSLLLTLPHPPSRVLPLGTSTLKTEPTLPLTSYVLYPSSPLPLLSKSYGFTPLHTAHTYIYSSISLRTHTHMCSGAHQFLSGWLDSHPDSCSCQIWSLLLCSRFLPWTSAAWTHVCWVDKLPECMPFSSRHGPVQASLDTEFWVWEWMKWLFPNLVHTPKSWST